jgi:ribosomal protein L24
VGRGRDPGAVREMGDKMKRGDTVEILVGPWKGSIGTVHKITKAFVRIKGVPGTKGLLHIRHRDLRIIY